MATYIYPLINATLTGGATEVNQDTIIAELQQSVVDQLDTNVLDASSTNIPASASTPVTVVASLAADVKSVHFQDTTGGYVGVYSDPAGTPVLEAIINPGSDSVIQLRISSGTVLGLRNMENSVINLGSIAIQFLG